jgi:Serine aminopeptidase, S33
MEWWKGGPRVGESTLPSVLPSTLFVHRMLCHSLAHLSTITKHRFRSVHRSAFSWALPKLVLPGAGTIEPEAVCRDPEVVIHIRNDPLYYHGSMKARTGAECLKMMAHIKESLASISFPFLTCRRCSHRARERVVFVLSLRWCRCFWWMWLDGCCVLYAGDVWLAGWLAGCVGN